MHGIVIQLNPGANLYVRVCFAQSFDLIEVDPVVVAIVIGKGDVAQAPRARRIHPRLQELARVRLHPMPLRMRVVIGKQSSMFERSRLDVRCFSFLNAQLERRTPTARS